MADTIFYASIPAKRLKTDILSTDSNFKLRDIVWYTGSDAVDVNLDSTIFGTAKVGYGVFEPNTPRQEFFTFDATNMSVATTTGLTILTRGLPWGSDYSTESSIRKHNHASGTAVLLSTNAPALYNSFANKFDDESIDGIWTFDADDIPRLDAQGTWGVGTEEYFVTKRYADSLAIAGAPDASTTQKGIVEKATSAETQTGTDSGGTTAPLFAAPSDIAKNTQNQQHVYGTDVVGTDAYAINPLPAVAAYAIGQRFSFKAGAANTTAATLNVSALGAKDIKKFVDGAIAALETGDIILGMIVDVEYDGTQFLMMSARGSDMTTAINTETKNFFGSTDITGAEAETLTNDSDSSDLHYHDELRNAESMVVTNAYFRGQFNDGLTSTQNGTGTVSRLLASTRLFVTAAGDDAMLSASNSVVHDTTGAEVAADFEDDFSYHTTFSAKFSAITDQDFFWGLIETVPAEAPPDATLTLRHVAFMVQDGTIYASVADGTTQSRTDVSSGITLTAFNEFRFEFTGNGSALFYINGTLVATKATNTPVDGTAAVSFAGVLTGVGANDKFIFIKHPFYLKVANYS